MAAIDDFISADLAQDRVDTVWRSYDDQVAPNALEVYIARLRRKLERSNIEIVTVRGLGYKFES